MRLLGIDYGTKRIGVALSDEAGRFAMPYSVIGNSRSLSDGLAGEIEKMATVNGVKEIVIGESNDYQGEANPVMAPILELKGRLEDKGFIVRLEPEFMTSAEAERIQGKNANSDASAAALILQAYLDKEKR